MLLLLLGVRGEQSDAKLKLLSHLRERLFLDESNSRVMCCYDAAPPAQAEARERILQERRAQLCGRVAAECTGVPVVAVAFGKWPCEMCLQSAVAVRLAGCAWLPGPALRHLFKSVWVTYDLGAGIVRSASLPDMAGVLAGAAREAGLWRGLNRAIKPFSWTRYI